MILSYDLTPMIREHNNYILIQIETFIININLLDINIENLISLY